MKTQAVVLQLMLLPADKTDAAVCGLLTDPAEGVAGVCIDHL